MTTGTIIRQISRLKTSVIEAVKAGDKAAEVAAFAKLKKYFPKIAATLEAELKQEAEAKAAAELKLQEEVLAKAKAEMQELTLAEVVKQNAELKSELAEFKELFHRFSDAAMKNDAKHENIIAELHDQIHELQSHCSGAGSSFGDEA